MSRLKINGPRIAGIATCVPKHRFDNVKDTTEFTKDEVRKVVAMAGVAARRVVDRDTCSTDLCYGAAETLLNRLDCDRASIDVLIMVTQTPDYFMPSSSCLLQDRLGLDQECAAFDVGLGCSGYVYALWLGAALMATGGHRRILVLHGETPTLYASEADRSVSLLFGDAGSATLLERANDDGTAPWSFVLRTDGHGSNDLIVEAGGFRDRFNEDTRKHFVSMHGSNVFNFTINVLPPLMRDTLDLAGMETNDVDYYIFHQSNRFIMNHVMKKAGLPVDRVPIILGEFGNPGGPSVPLTITQGKLKRPEERSLSLMLLGYGVGLSWGSALLGLDPEAVLCHAEWPRE